MKHQKPDISHVTGFISGAAVGSVGGLLVSLFHHLEWGSANVAAFAGGLFGAAVTAGVPVAVFMYQRKEAKRGAALRAIWYCQDMERVVSLEAILLDHCKKGTYMGGWGALKSRMYGRMQHLMSICMGLIDGPAVDIPEILGKVSGIRDGIQGAINVSDPESIAKEGGEALIMAVLDEFFRSAKGGIADLIEYLQRIAFA